MRVSWNVAHSQMGYAAFTQLGWVANRGVFCLVNHALALLRLGRLGCLCLAWRGGLIGLG